MLVVYLVLESVVFISDHCQLNHISMVVSMKRCNMNSGREEQLLGLSSGIVTCLLYFKPMHSDIIDQILETHEQNAPREPWGSPQLN